MTWCALSVTHHTGWQILLWDPIKGSKTKINTVVTQKQDFTASMLHDSCQYQERGGGGDGGGGGERVAYLVKGGEGQMVTLLMLWDSCQ